MKTKEMAMVKVTESALLSLVSYKLNNSVLFPGKIEKTKKHLNGAKFAKS